MLFHLVLHALAIITLSCAISALLVIVACQIAHWFGHARLIFIMIASGLTLSIAAGPGRGHVFILTTVFFQLATIIIVFASRSRPHQPGQSL